MTRCGPPALDTAVARVLYAYERFGLLACASPNGPVPGCALPGRDTLDKNGDARVSGGSRRSPRCC